MIARPPLPLLLNLKSSFIKNRVYDKGGDVVSPFVSVTSSKNPLQFYIVQCDRTSSRSYGCFSLEEFLYRCLYFALEPSFCLICIRGVEVWMISSRGRHPLMSDESINLPNGGFHAPSKLWMIRVCGRSGGREVCGALDGGSALALGRVHQTICAMS